MKRGLAALIPLLFWNTAAYASGYDDFTRGLTALVRGENDAALTAFTSAIQSTDLAPAYLPTAYRERAHIYLELRRCQDAMADLGSAETLRPLDASGIMFQAAIKICLKDGPGAQKDFDTAMGPISSFASYWEFGRRLWGADQFDTAYPDLLKAAEMLPNDNRNEDAPYVVLWYAVGASSAHKLDAAKLSSLSDKLIVRSWPRPLLELYVGEITPEAALDELPRQSSERYAGRKCEADFYIGEWYLAHDKADAGKQSIAAAAKECDKGYIEHEAAVAEARRLGIPESKEVSQ